MGGVGEYSYVMLLYVPLGEGGRGTKIVTAYLSRLRNVSWVGRELHTLVGCAQQSVYFCEPQTSLD
jgi:hypothetical protein